MISVTDQLVADMMEKAEKDGVAVARVTDGVVYIFTKDKLAEMLASCEEADSDKIVVFVKDNDDQKVLVKSPGFLH